MLDPRLLLFSDGTFTRSTEAWYSTTPGLAVGSVVSAATGVPRIRTVGGVNEYLGELSRTQRVKGNTSRLDSASWVPETGATIDSEVVASVFSGEAADRLNFGADPLSRLTCDLVGTTDGMTVVVSAIARTSAGSKDFRIFVRRRDNAQVSFTFTATPTPTRFYAATDLVTGSFTPQFRLINGASGGAGSIIVDHVQVEDYTSVALPTSPIRKIDSAVAVTRAADRLSYASLPAEFIDGLWHVRMRSDLPSTSRSETIAVLTRSGGAFLQMQVATVLRARNTAGANTNLTAPATAYAAHEAVDLYGDFRSPTNSALQAESATGGVDTGTGNHEPFTDGAFDFGQAATIGLNVNIATWFSEPRPGKELV